MQPSRFNILSPIKDSDCYIILNLLSGHADLITEAEAKALSAPAGAFADICRQKGYFIDPEQERQQYWLKYVDFLEQRNEEEVQVFFVPTYQCNFRCSYCYQSDYLPSPLLPSPEIVDAFFRFLQLEMADRKHYVTLFGGEPLLPGRAYMDAIEAFIKLCGKNGTDLAVVTNGYHLDLYLDMFKNAVIREIQITLDGSREVHDRRRPHASGQPSFDVIVSNLERCLENNYPVNLRVVVDKDNMEDLPRLAGFAMDRGWTSHPLFKTQLGRNYELHRCNADQHQLYTRLEMYQDLYQLIRNFPEFMEFHQPAFSVTKFLFDNGRLPGPLFDACPACKSEWALDYTGAIYPCTATVGKTGEEVGRFFPDIHFVNQAVKEWQNRDVTTLAACQDCSVQLACGGGCGSLSKNRNGLLLSPDCRPVKELVGLGSAVFFS